MIELEKIPHIGEISNHGPYHGARQKNTATFQARSTRQNKLVPSLEEAIRRTGLRDGMTISFHHHFRNGDHIINTVVDKLAEMGYKNLPLAASSRTMRRRRRLGSIAVPLAIMLVLSFAYGEERTNFPPQVKCRQSGGYSLKTPLKRATLPLV